MCQTVRYNLGIMLQLSATILNQPVLSLRTGLQVATATTPIINPNNLKIEGFYCEDTGERKTLVLLEQDIREIIRDGIVINDFDVLAEEEDLIRLKEVLKLGFHPVGMTVVTVSKQRLGKVSDFAVDVPSFIIKKLYVNRSILKSLTNAQFGIDRTQIVEITDRKIVVQDLLQLTRASVPAGLPAN
jgi:uncharacterized protein YrrD